MLDWIAAKIWAIVTYLPPVFVEFDSPVFTIVRGAFALLLIVLVVFLIAMWPSRSRLRRLFARRGD
ncbi:MAG: hypothetical protein KIT25_14990 [Enhydrobacter sp.]|nr:MAG: hypothetical protein KIT25_14990 [Enhydrobacter sp.]